MCCERGLLLGDWMGRRGVAGGAWGWLLGRWSAKLAPTFAALTAPKGALSTLGRPGGAEADCAAVLCRGAAARNSLRFAWGKAPFRQPRRV